MSELRDQFDDLPEPSLPQGLSDELKRMYPAGRVRSDVDEAILSAGRQKMARLRQWRRVLRWGGAAAAAAVLAIGVRVVWVEMRPTSVVVREDLNRDGRVDILDAFMLARGVEGKSAPKAWDLNGDGKVDQADVDLLAKDAVSVTPGRMQ